MKVKSFLPLLIALFSSVGAFAQESVSWKFALEDKGNGVVHFVAQATVDPGWHLYDVNIPEGGPTPTTLSIDKIAGATPTGSFKAEGRKAHEAFDPNFDMTVGTFDGTVKFVQALKITDRAQFALEGDVRAQACNDETCTPPLPVDFAFGASDLPEPAKASVETKPAETVETKTPLLPIDAAPALDTDTVTQAQQPDTTAISASDSSAELDKDALWTPVIEQLKEYGMEGNVSGRSLWGILLAGFVGGLIALLTPCVWPMIPMTVSFFLKRNKSDRQKAISQAVWYGLSIIVIYVFLGLIITAIFGASALNDLSTSAVFNLLFFALLVVFAISFFGAFELVLPSSWTNKMDAKADRTSGLLSLFFMAFTLALVSFSCTGPIIGTLLVETAVSGSYLGPAVGMFGFALALAIPFALFAIFPSWLQNMPKSGGWLNSVKVVLGFLELALALKFLSVADLAYGWGILDREVFLVLWIVIFALLGMYLIGKLKLPHDSDLPHVSVPRLFLSIVSFAFALYMVPGLWGAPLKAISAFSPPIYTQDMNLYEGVVHPKSDDYETGMLYAKQTGKPVLIDFSGFGCVNCRKMEASVWTDPRVKNILENDYVLISLMVDDKTKLPAQIEIDENGRKTKLKTIGDKWSYLQRHKFGVSGQPYYVALDNEGKPIAPSYAYDENADKYIEFLRTGLKNYKK
ncbi:MAG: thioredoxin family protein [Dysgonamonadaceae bacterium]|jgi:thiol:disulfide interchange protein DsbD|nr:thioredoxin family protein [Dysgonamonadaceae bacterium]